MTVLGLISTDNLDPGGQEVADGDGAPRRSDHQAEGPVAGAFAHFGRSDERVGEDFGQRAIIADAAGEQKVIVLNAFIHDASLVFPGCDRLANAAEATNLIESAQVMLMPGFENVAAVQTHPLGMKQSSGATLGGNFACGDRTDRTQRLRDDEVGLESDQK